ncbi:histone deacetylase 2 isoform X2 [Rutidosis leptorrhynchoides]|uniref:histone deacetylase 2 isoform X2 n=1 Tax=Rutidosis leptorrhynchoides TaxID=125765 RepID=UPI003A9A26F3
MYLLHKKLYLHISPHSHHITTVSQPSPVPLHLLLLLRLYSPPASSTLHDSLTMSALPSTADPSSPSNSASKNTENDETIRRNRILSSKLYFDIPPSKVHSESYLRSLKSSLTVSIITEVPPVAVFPNCLVQKKVLYPFRKQVGGTVLAAKLANERGYAINVGGGFHHCCADRGGGFCVYADISLCIHYAFIRLNISRVMIIDLDAHQGNGHETDFSDDRRVYILDMYNPYIYPLDYEARRYIDQRVEVPSGTTTEEYLVKLDEALQVAGNAFNPELVIYNAGTDILDGDPLGRLKVSPDGVSIRDEKVFRFARDKNIPLVMLTSGGYMKSSARVIADSIINLSNKSLITICGI